MAVSTGLICSVVCVLCFLMQCRMKGSFICLLENDPTKA